MDEDDVAPLKDQGAAGSEGSSSVDSTIAFPPIVPAETVVEAIPASSDAEEVKLQERWSEWESCAAADSARLDEISLSLRNLLNNSTSSSPSKSSAFTASQSSLPILSSHDFGRLMEALRRCPGPDARHALLSDLSLRIRIRASHLVKILLSFSYVAEQERTAKLLVRSIADPEHLIFQVMESRPLLPARVASVLSQ